MTAAMIAPLPSRAARSASSRFLMKALMITAVSGATSAMAAQRAPVVVPSVPEVEHESQLTRETVTSAVHYVRFRLGPAEIDAFRAGPVRLAVAHPAYPDGLPGTELSQATREELSHDLLGG